MLAERPDRMHRGVLRIVMLVASDPAGFDQRDCAAFPVRCSVNPDLPSGPVRRGWDDRMDDPKVISGTVAVRLAVP